MWPIYWSNFAEKLNGSDTMSLIVWKYPRHEVLRRCLDIRASIKLVNGNYVPKITR